MYGDGNSSKLVGDIINSTTKITDGLTEATGVDIRALLAGFLGGKIAAPAPMLTETDSAEKITDIPEDTGEFSEE